MKKNFKAYAIILWIISLLIFIGLQSHWQFESWRVLDWIIIVANIYLGYKLYNAEK